MKYTEEDKKAIDFIEEQNKNEEFILVCEINPEFVKELSKMLGINFKENKVIINTNILLNLVYKLQRNLEEKEDEIVYLKEQTRKAADKERNKAAFNIYKNYISKEKIRELLTETYCGIPLYTLNHNYLPRSLKGLLGE